MMAKAAASPILQLIRRVVEDPQVRELPDQDLLQRFHSQHDEAAFHTLLRRHGPMVLDLCRGVLGDGPDAEDAFQATFLVLAQKTGSIRKGASLGSFLHGVAHRTALKARAQFAARQKHEACAPGRQASALDDLSWREVRQVLHEELGSIPECYREPLVVCYLEGATQQHAAARLGLAERTLRERLERGRELLRARLVRRGLGPAAILVSAAWPAASASAGVPMPVMVSTVKAATGVAAGGTATSLVSAKVAALTEGMVKGMFVTKLKIATATALSLAALFICGAMVAQLGGLPGPTAAAQEKDKPEKPKTDKEQLQGTWSVVSSEAKGVSHTTAETGLREYKLTFKADKVTTQWVASDEREPNSGGGEHDYTIDPAKSPKELSILTKIPMQVRFSGQGYSTNVLLRPSGDWPSEGVFHEGDY